MKEQHSRQRGSGLPEPFRKGAALSTLGAAVGAGLGDLIGWFIAGREAHFIFAGAGAAVGIIIGFGSALMFRRRMQISGVERIEAGTELIGGIIGFVLGVAGIVGFAMTGKWIGLVGAVFFFSCGWYLVARHRAHE